MATMVKAIPKPEVAAGLRKRIAALTAEISDLNEKLAKAQGTLDLFDIAAKTNAEKRPPMGRPRKERPGPVRQNRGSRIAREALRDRLAVRTRDLDAAKGQLREVENEIRIGGRPDSA